MKSLEKKHPLSYRYLCDGGFVVRRSTNHSFNCVATDQALEQTVNRDGKSKGGVIGLTLQKGALSRWLQTRHMTAEYMEAFKTFCSDSSSSDKPHEQLGKARMARDEHDICKIIEVAGQYQNLFDLETVPSQLINIVTGHIASAEVSSSLKTFLERGRNKQHDFLCK